MSAGQLQITTQPLDWRMLCERRSRGDWGCLPETGDIALTSCSPAPTKPTCSSAANHPACLVVISDLPVVRGGLGVRVDHSAVCDLRVHKPVVGHLQARLHAALHDGHRIAKQQGTIGAGLRRKGGWRVAEANKSALPGWCVE